MHSNTSIGTLRKLGAMAAATLALAAAVHAAPANAETVTATGKATKDKAVAVEMDLNAGVKKGTAGAKSLNRVAVKNAEFACSATGYEGRTDYAHYYLDAVKIKKGKFSSVDELTARGHVIERWTLKGKVEGKGKSLTVTGTFKAERSEGGLEFNNCHTATIPFKLKKRV